MSGIQFQILIAQSFDLNAELSGGRSAIHYAGDMGQTDVAKYLVEKGADINVRPNIPHKYFVLILQKKDVHGITALLAAIWEGHTSTVEFLLSAVPHCPTAADPRAPTRRSRLPMVLRMQAAPSLRR